MMDPVNVIASSAVILNVCAVASGWAVLFANPGFIHRTFGKVVSLDPVYIAFAMVMATTSLSMYLSLLLAWWFMDPGIRSHSTFAAEMFMAYHAATGVAATAFHGLIALVAKSILPGEKKDVAVAERSALA